MNIKHHVIEELQEMFRKGATPSRLIQHISECHSGEQRLHFLVQDYFREAFGVDIVRGVGFFDPSAVGDLRYAYWNDDLLDEMVAKQATWNSDVNHQDEKNSSWFGSLTAKSIYEHLEKAAASEMADWGDTWNRLGPKEKAEIRRIVAGFNWRSEKVEILTRLAERLQQRVNELENQLKKEAATAVTND